jgi:hypothetical protein
MYRLALTVKAKPAGVSVSQRATASGLASR